MLQFLQETRVHREFMEGETFSVSPKCTSVLLNLLHICPASMLRVNVDYPQIIFSSMLESQPLVSFHHLCILPFLNFLCHE